MTVTGANALLLLLSLPFFAAAKTNKAGLDFLALKKTEEGVVELPSGLQYKAGIALLFFSFFSLCGWRSWCFMSASKPQPECRRLPRRRP